MLGVNIVEYLSVAVVDFFTFYTEKFTVPISILEHASKIKNLFRTSVKYEMFHELILILQFLQTQIKSEVAAKHKLLNNVLRYNST